MLNFQWRCPSALCQRRSQNRTTIKNRHTVKGRPVELTPYFLSAEGNQSENET
ncbi:hypothetical protein NWP21_17095 [Anabaenopsis sp. FSS-46]|uniref:hypothetical protein n=1 Tax=Anabaenopsis TaxID=110103 RepID=UPI00232E793D|nr:MULTISPECIES: hypothetical protein [Anabaenopsis]MDH6100521.1 hypothetical protein [Anabaenopsis sp. FSS-46]